MAHMNRRDFLKLGAGLGAMMGMNAVLSPQIAEALAELAAGNAPVLWLQGQSCSGCSVSLLNTDSPSVAEVLLSYISLKFHSSLSVATGEVSMRVMHDTIREGGYVLVAEGAVPTTMRDACIVGGEVYADQLIKAAKSAKAVITVGACASHGGVPGAEGNPTGAMSAADFIRQEGVSTPVIRVPGCPAHPDWLVGTVVHALKFGMPELDSLGRPVMFFGKTIHEQCNRFPDYERERFAQKPGDDGCYFKIGCAGPITNADCTWRQWNCRTNHCIKAGAPCVGCASKDFARRRDFPLIVGKRRSKA